MPHRNKIVTFLLVLILLLLIADYLPQAHASPLYSISPADILAGVNALRANQGLAPYKVDGMLMSYAQEHANHMAQTGDISHRQSDGSMPFDHGIIENVACGTDDLMTIGTVIYSIWADPVHLKTMTGYTTGWAGAGVATNGNNVYISLDVRPGSVSSASARTGNSGPGSQTEPTQVPLIAPVVTSTPKPDGSIVHIVGSGQSLWQIAIAYGVHINEILALNGLPANSTMIYEGQRLVILPAGSVTPIPTPTMTAAATLAVTTEATKPAKVEPTATHRSTTATQPAPTVTKPALTNTPLSTGVSGQTMVKGLKLTTNSVLVGGIFLAAAILFVVFLMSFRK